MVQDLVHPSWYPFVYGKTRFLCDEVVGVEDAIQRWVTKGAPIIPKVDPRNTSILWSEKYQWLPANVSFQDNGTVKFTSYINNLHPTKHPEIYRLTEQLIEIAIPAWDRILTPWTYEGRPCITPRRIGLGPLVYDENGEQAEELWDELNLDLIASYEAEHGEIEIDMWHEDAPEHYLSLRDREELQDKEARRARDIARMKWQKLREPKLPEPEEFRPLNFEASSDLRTQFKDTGLQVIVKMASIELTPEKPMFPEGGWHIEGKNNEHIVATALYYLDSDNVTPSYLSFRMVTDEVQEELSELTGQNEHEFYGYVCGTSLVGGPAIQAYGRVETREGRFLAFPNVMQHRVSGFGLKDKTKPGHRRFIALWLVDPSQRIISTANVPPQRFDWWAEVMRENFSSAAKHLSTDPPHQQSSDEEEPLTTNDDVLRMVFGSSYARLPAELKDMILTKCKEMETLMTKEEAETHLKQLMDERTMFDGRKVGSPREGSYNFCEH